MFILADTQNDFDIHRGSLPTGLFGARTLFFPPHQHPCDGGTMDLHGPRRAEFLTAEAADTAVSIDDRFFAFHGDSFGGADACAFGTANALTRLQLRAGVQQSPQGLAYQLAA